MQAIKVPLCTVISCIVVQRWQAVATPLQSGCLFEVLHIMGVCRLCLMLGQATVITAFVETLCSTMSCRAGTLQRSYIHAALSKPVWLIAAG